MSNSPPGAQKEVKGGTHLRAPEPLTVTTGSSMGLKWQEWLEDFEDYIEGSKIEPEKDKIIALRNLGGREISKIVREIPTTEGDTYAKVRDVLNNHFLHKRNVHYERHKFHQQRQGKEEPLSSFIHRLRRQSQYSDFTNFSPDTAIKSQIISGCHSESLRRRLLRKPQELAEIEENSRLYDQAEENAADIETKPSTSNEHANRVSDRRHGRQDQS